MKFGVSRLSAGRYSSSGVTPHDSRLFGGYKYGGITRYGYVLLNPQATGQANTVVYTNGLATFGVGVTGNSDALVFVNGAGFLPLNGTGSADATVYANGLALFGLDLQGSSEVIVTTDSQTGVGIGGGGSANVVVFANAQGRVYTYSVYPKVVGEFTNDFVRGRFILTELNGRFLSNQISGRF